jgi:DNA polymerase-3 subunit epsilon
LFGPGRYFASRNPILMKVPDEFSSEPESVNLLVIEEPNRWEYLLASELLKVRMVSINDAFFDLGTRAATVEKRQWDIDTFIPWVAASTMKFEPVVSRVESLLGVDIQKALGPPGIPANLIELQSIAERVKDLCQDLLVWEQEAITILPPVEFEGAVAILRGWPKVFLDVINEFVSAWEFGFRQPPNAEGKLAVSINLKINPPPRSSELRQMITRHEELISHQLNSLRTGSRLSSQATLDQLAALSFTAIDFETANEQRTSLCAIGVAEVENGVITKTWKQLVHPPELRVEPRNQAVNRISLEDLLNAPTFPEVWDEFKEMIEGRVVVAHNSEFDMNVLEQTLNYYTLDKPNFRSLCTLKLSHVAFPQLDDYRLGDVTAYLGLEFRHHACDEDARVCAEIAIQAIPRVSLKKLDLEDFDLSRGLVKVPSKTKVSGLSEAYSDKRIDSDLLKPQLEGANPNHPFYGKRLVFTGDLRAMQRSEAAVIVRAFGADINTTISKKTQIVVLGDGAGPSKLKKIEELQDQGVEIRLIYEEEFLQLIGELS